MFFCTIIFLNPFGPTEPDIKLSGRILPNIQCPDVLLLFRPVYYDYARPAASTAATLAGSAVSGKGH